jgi:hypothetical protein
MGRTLTKPVIEEVVAQIRSMYEVIRMENNSDKLISSITKVFIFIVLLFLVQ